MEEDIQNYSPTVMFRGTPCKWRVPYIKKYKKMEETLLNSNDLSMDPEIGLEDEMVVLAVGLEVEMKVMAVGLEMR